MWKVSKFVCRRKNNFWRKQLSPLPFKTPILSRIYDVIERIKNKKKKVIKGKKRQKTPTQKPFHSDSPCRRHPERIACRSTHAHIPTQAHPSLAANSYHERVPYIEPTLDSLPCEFDFPYRLRENCVSEFNTNDDNYSCQSYLWRKSLRTLSQKSHLKRSDKDSGASSGSDRLECTP